MCGIVGILNSSSLKNNSIDILKKLEFQKRLNNILVMQQKLLKN